ncbi:hypothetical protein M422DRAFT_246033 [Sphaerobolus stellatus SS14]|nr:hypothetical protein M422DRAFT_246033 [Sphaerobolus stellatus SS14]
MSFPPEKMCFTATAGTALFIVMIESCSRRPHAALCDLSGCSTALYPTLTPPQPPVFYSQAAPHLTSATGRPKSRRRIDFIHTENRRRPLFDSDTASPKLPALRYNTASTFSYGKKPIPISHDGIRAALAGSPAFVAKRARSTDPEDRLRRSSPEVV